MQLISPIHPKTMAEPSETVVLHGPKGGMVVVHLVKNNLKGDFQGREKCAPVKCPKPKCGQLMADGVAEDGKQKCYRLSLQNNCLAEKHIHSIIASRVQESCMFNLSFMWVY